MGERCECSASGERTWWAHSAFTRINIDVNDVDLESIRVDCAASTLAALESKEAEMRRIGCDLHPSQQSIAMRDRDTGAVIEKTLRPEGEMVRTFYASDSAVSRVFASSALRRIRCRFDEGLFETAERPLAKGHAASVTIAEAVVQPEGTGVRGKCVQPNGLIPKRQRSLFSEAHKKPTKTPLLVRWMNHQAMDDGGCYAVDAPRHTRVFRVLVFVEDEKSDEFGIEKRGDIRCAGLNVG